MRAMQLRTRSQGGQTGPLSLGASFGLLTVLFVAAVFFFLTRDASPLTLLNSFAPGSHADYAFTLEQRVAPQRAATQPGS